jgi:protein disulfide-isomerase-like protein
VENLTPYSFQQNVLSSSRLWLVEFYAPWCGHCTRFAPEYEQVALALKGKVKVGKVNCDKYGGMCNRAAITGYPTVRFYRGQDKGDMQDYFSQDIKDREQDKIVMVVEQLVKRSQGMDDKDKQDGNGEQEEVHQNEHEHDEHGNDVKYEMNGENDEYQNYQDVGEDKPGDDDYNYEVDDEKKGYVDNEYYEDEGHDKHEEHDEL